MCYDLYNDRLFLNIYLEHNSAFLLYTLHNLKDSIQLKNTYRHLYNSSNLFICFKIYIIKNKRLQSFNIFISWINRIAKAINPRNWSSVPWFGVSISWLFIIIMLIVITGRGLKGKYTCPCALFESAHYWVKKSHQRSFSLIT